jgi:hypothetical protein
MTIVTDYLVAHTLMIEIDIRTERILATVTFGELVFCGDHTFSSFGSSSSGSGFISSIGFVSLFRTKTPTVAPAKQNNTTPIDWNTPDVNDDTSKGNSGPR